MPLNYVIKQRLNQHKLYYSQSYNFDWFKSIERFSVWLFNPIQPRHFVNIKILFKYTKKFRNLNNKKMGTYQTKQTP